MTLGPSALAGRRLAAATAGLRKASELFVHSCVIDSHNEPDERRAARCAVRPRPARVCALASCVERHIIPAGGR